MESIEKWWKLLYVILNRSDGERKKESKNETYKQVAVKRKERKKDGPYGQILSLC